MIIQRRSGDPINNGRSVRLELPHASTNRQPSPMDCALVDAHTGEPLPVIAASLHLNTHATMGCGCWLVAELLVDENDEPLTAAVTTAAAAHPEFFSPAVRTALFRFRVDGFTTGPVVDRAAYWHPGVETAQDGHLDAEAKGLRSLEVHVRSGGTRAVTANHFESQNGFVFFYRYPDAAPYAMFAADEVLDVQEAPTTGRRLLQVDREQLRTLRSAVAWDLERTATSDRPSEYRQALAAVADLLGLPPQHNEAADTEAPADTCDDTMQATPR